MKKVIALIVTVAVLAGAVFAGLQFGMPLISLTRTAAALDSYDGHYDITLYEMSEGAADQEQSYIISADRTGNVFGGTMSIPYKLSENSDVSRVELDGFFDMDSMELMIDFGSSLESMLPDSVIELASSLNLLGYIEGKYIAASQVAAVLTEITGENPLADLENLADQVNMTGSVLKNISGGILFSTDVLKNTGLLRDGYSYYKAKYDGVDGVIYIGCPKKYDDSHLELMIYVDFTDETTTDFAAVISADAGATSVSMPDSVISDEQLEEIIDTISGTASTLKKLFGQ